jgi:hypothetical protein
MPVTSCQPSIFNLLQGGIPDMSLQQEDGTWPGIYICGWVLESKNVSADAKIIYGLIASVFEGFDQNKQIVKIAEIYKMDIGLIKLCICELEEANFIHWGGNGWYRGPRGKK